jgi:hypothetical protein
MKPPAVTTWNKCPPETTVGTDLLVVVPSPSCPRSLAPQQNADPALVTPQVWFAPASILANFSPPDTATGSELLVVVPSPIWPRSLFPKQ